MAWLPGIFGKTSRSSAWLALGLQTRVLLALLAALAVSLLVGGLLSVWHAKRSVDLELRAAMAASSESVREGLAEAASLEHGEVALRRLVRSFDGERHVRVSVLNGRGEPVLSSTPLVPQVLPPAWFVAMLDPKLPVERRLAPPGLAGVTAVVVSAAPLNEIAEVWVGFGDALLALGLSAALALVLIRPALARALRPLETVSGALGDIAEGDYAVRVPEAGPPETRTLSHGFNRMAAELAAVDAENRRLQAQLLTLQEEERAELARDLHDDIGPYLFAVGIDAAAVADLARAGRTYDVAARAALITSAVVHMQAQVRDILGRLRPMQALEFGLGAALEDLIAFWRARQPDVAFTLAVDLDDEALGAGERETLYRIAQEALNNALKHGRPSAVVVRVSRAAGGDALLEVQDDGEAGATPRPGVRYGLVGMGERLEAVGGELVVDRAAAGWRVLARAPMTRAVSAA